MRKSMEEIKWSLYPKKVLYIGKIILIQDTNEPPCHTAA
jgi:hypothetical protein